MIMLFELIFIATYVTILIVKTEED